MEENNIKPNDIVLNKKDENRRLYIIIVIMFCIILGLGGFIVYDKIIKKDTKNDNTNNNQVIEKDTKNDVREHDEIKEPIVSILTESDKEKLINLIDEYNKFFATFIPVDDVNDFPNQYKLKFLYRKIGTNYNDIFTKDDLKKAANQYFDKDFKFTNEDIKDEISTLYKYDDTTGTYKYAIEFGYDGGDMPLSFTPKSYLIDSSYDSNSKLYSIKVKTLYTYCSSICGPLDVVYGSANLNDLIFSIKRDYDEGYKNAKVYLDCTKDSVDENKEKCNTTDVVELAHELAFEYVKERTYYFTKLDSGNFALKYVK